MKNKPDTKVTGIVSNSNRIAVPSTIQLSNILHLCISCFSSSLELFHNIKAFECRRNSHHPVSVFTVTAVLFLLLLMCRQVGVALTYGNLKGSGITDVLTRPDLGERCVQDVPLLSGR